MQRVLPYVGIITALALGVFIVILYNVTAIPRTTPIILPTISATTTSSVATTSINSAQPPSTQTVPVPKKTTPSSPAPAASTPTSPTESAAEINAELDASATTVRTALVNIICTVPAGSDLHSISGSGIIIDPKGIILTDAHVAQYFLLADRGVSCVIRSGSPASDSYDAALEYISPAWLRANPDVLTESAPTGTGEHDFALLGITESATSSALPAAFPYIPLATTPPDAGALIVIATYGAQFISSSQITSDLFPTVVYGSVKDVFTFGTNTIDVLSLGGSAAAQEGSSGGGISGVSGTLIGTITTSTISGATNTRSLNAITASYIRADYASETGSALDLLLAESPAMAIANFAPQIPALEAIITAHQ